MALLPHTKAKTPIGILKAVIKAIREEPKRYDQGDWIYELSSDENGPACGTVACVAGWTCVLASQSHGSAISTDVDIKAQRILGLDYSQAYDLFNGGAIERIDPEAKIGTTRYVEAGVKHIIKFMREEMGYTGPDL